MSEIKYEIIKKIGVLSKSNSGWEKQLNLISWSINCMGCPRMRSRLWKAGKNER